MGYRPTIKIFNTLTRQKEDLVPQLEGEVGVYVCGPTVYSYVHLGNARTFTSFDLIVRYLRYSGYQVKFVRNFTDVDDKIIQAAHQSGETPEHLADRFVQAFEEDAKSLRLTKPDASPRVTEHIDDILALIGKLIGSGIAYQAEGNVYFSVRQFPNYARLSRRPLDSTQEGEHVQLGEYKRDALDFALWKSAKPNEPRWDSPWGPGRPGWHIECSAMCMKFFGSTVDIHGGGVDLTFPHHDNEIAQSEAASQRPFSRCWMHSGMLDLEGAKMSKSLGNVVGLRDALAQVDGEALRLFFLSTHYRNPLTFAEKSLRDAEGRLEYYYETIARARDRIAGIEQQSPVSLDDNPGRFLSDFEAAMNDDFNSAAAMSAMAGLFNALNEWLAKPPAQGKVALQQTLRVLIDDARKMGVVLGVLNDAPKDWLERRRARAVRERGIDTAEVERLLACRAQARGEKNFQSADRCREELKQLGIEIQDTPQGTRWKVSSQFA